MNFQQFLLLAEALDAKLKDMLLKGKYGENTPEQIKSAIDELEQEYEEKDGPDKPTAFKFMQNRLGLKAGEVREAPKDPFFAKYYEKLKKKQIFPEEYKTLELFKNENKELLTEMMDKLREFISNNKITLSFDTKPKIKFKNEVLDDYKNFTEFMSIIHSIEGQLADVNIDKYQNPALLEMQSKADLVAKGDNIWVFKGDDPVKCRIMGKGQNWCISSSTSVMYYFYYRHNYGQTQYFIFDFNKKPDDPARYVNPGVAPEGEYSEWVDRRNTHPIDQDGVAFDINGYNSLKQYLAYLKSKGVDTSVFKADPITDYEKKLKEFINTSNFEGAKNYPDERKTKDGIPYMFYFYLKTVNKLTDEQFNSLSNIEKDQFLLGKEDITENQIEYLISQGVKFFKEYISSITTTHILFYRTKNKKQLAKLIYENKKEIQHSDILDLMIYEPMVLTKLKKPIQLSDYSGAEEHDLPNKFGDPQKNTIIQFMLDHGFKNNNLSKKLVYQIFDYVINQKGKLLFNINDIIKYFKDNANVIAREPSNEEIEMNGSNPDYYNSLKFYDTLTNKNQTLSQAYENYKNVTNVLNKENIYLDFKNDPKKDIYYIGSLLQTPEDVKAFEKLIPKDQIIELMNSYTPETHMGLDVIQKLYDKILSSKKIDQVANNLAKYINQLSTPEIVEFINDNHNVFYYYDGNSLIKTIIDILLEKSKDNLTPEDLQSELIAFNKLKNQDRDDDNQKYNNNILKTILNRINSLYKATDSEINLGIIQDKLSNIRTKY